MNQSYFFISIFILLLFLCSSDRSFNTFQNTQVASVIGNDLKSKRINPFKQFIDSSIQIDFASVLFSFSELYITLCYRDSYTDKVFSELTSEVKPIYKHIESIRFLINQELAKKYLKTEYLEQIVLTDSLQKVIGKADLKQFEYYSKVHDFFLASYGNEYPSNSKIAFSSIGEKYIKSSPILTADSIYALDLVKSIGYQENECFDMKYSGIFFNDGGDIITVVSFNDHYCKPKNYIFRNELPTDSIVDNFYFEELVPVPLASHTQGLYMLQALVPASDFQWNELIGLDFEEVRFAKYPRNRIQIRNGVLKHN